jgi:hemerythrin-like domain-containing protein
VSGPEKQLAPTDLLKEEHTVVLLVVDAMDREAQSIRAGNPVHADDVTKMIAFMREFTDGCHHAKEERVLFPTLLAGDPAANGPVTVMLREHEIGRGHSRATVAALPRAAEGDTEAAAIVADNLAGYAEMLRAHIDKENRVLFPFAERALSPEDKQVLMREFERIEKEETGAGVHEKYHALARELAEAHSAA